MYWILKLQNNASSWLSFLYIQCIVGLLRRNDDAHLGGSPSELKLKAGRVAPYYRTHDYWVEELLKRREESVWMAQMHFDSTDSWSFHHLRHTHSPNPTSNPNVTLPEVWQQRSPLRWNRPPWLNQGRRMAGLARWFGLVLHVIGHRQTQTTKGVKLIGVGTV